MSFRKSLSLSTSAKSATPIPIAANEDGSLLMTTPFGAMRLDPVDSLLYQDRISGHLVAFKTDPQLRIRIKPVKE